MFRFIFYVLIFMLLYSILSSLLKVFFGKKPANNQKEGNTTVNDNQPHEKIFRKSEGEYVDFEEVKDNDTTKNDNKN